MGDAGPVHEARALILQFARSNLKAVELRTPQLSVFASRDPGIRLADSMFFGTRQPASANRTPAVEAEQQRFQVAAPHLGTLMSLAAAGTRLGTGGVYGRLAVLDDTIDLVAERDMVVVAHCAAPPALIEYGQPLIIVSP